MKSIVLTGGPSSGKTTVINRLQETFEPLGYNVIVIPEAATIAINSGIKPFGPTAINGVLYQQIILMRQLAFEKTARMAAEAMGDKTLIIYDRGTLDGYAYVTPQEWDDVLKTMDVSKRELLSSYDAVLFLESKSDFFTKENNAARYENDANEAIEKGQKCLKSYLSHDNLMVIQPREDMEDKLREVVNIVQNLMGCPEETREQRKFLVTDIDVDALAKIANKVVITQDYLEEKDNTEYRLRKVEQDGSNSYHYNVQQKGENGLRKIIKEASISKREYERFLQNKSDNFATVVKSRYSFVYNEQYFKLDIFEDGLMVLEVNVTKENPNLTIPDFVTAVEEVTNDEEYKNINMARRKVLHNEEGKVNSYRRN